jgi:hypothetical protein
MNNVGQRTASLFVVVGEFFVRFVIMRLEREKLKLDFCYAFIWLDNKES